MIEFLKKSNAHDPNAFLKNSGIFNWAIEAASPQRRSTPCLLTEQLQKHIYMQPICRFRWILKRKVFMNDELPTVKVVYGSVFITPTE